MPTLYFVHHSDFPEERDFAYVSEDEAKKSLLESQQTLTGEAWLSSYEYELSEEGVRRLAASIALDYCNNLKED